MNNFNIAYIPTWYDGEVNAGILRYTLEVSGQLEDSGARIRALPTGTYGGIISHRWEGSPESAYVAKQPCPVVEVSNFNPGKSDTRILPDWSAAGTLAAGHFLRLGIRQICACHAIDSCRDMAITAAVQDRTIRSGGTYWRFGAELNQRPRQELPQFFERELAQSSGQIGIVACHAYIAIAVISACQRLNLRIPQDVALITFASDAASIPASLVPLSEVTMDSFGQGYLAAQSLHRKMNERPVPPVQTVQPNGVRIRQSSTLSAVRDPLVQQIAIRIQQKHRSPINIPELLPDSKSTSRRTAERRFKTITGESIGEALTHARITTAKRFLQNEPNVPLRVVAKQSGFSTAQYMCRVFSEQMGCAPSAFRRPSFNQGID